MLLVVTGSSGAPDVLGLRTTEPTALLDAVADAGDQPVILLGTSGQLAELRRLAHVLVSARPRARVAVLDFDHHPLTLTLIAAAVRAEHAAEDDPGLLAAEIRRAAARSRSLVWYPRVLGLRSPQPGLGQLVSSVARSTGYFVELGPAAAVVPGKRGAGLGPADEVYLVDEPPALLLRQLGNDAERPTVRTVPVELSAGQPWSVRGCVPLSVLVTAATVPAGGACRICGAVQDTAGCVFCGTRPELDPSQLETVRQPLVREGSRG